MNKPHTVELEQLREWQQEAKVLFASSYPIDKQLYATCRGSYEVWHKKELVLKTVVPLIAVKKYNSLS